MSVPELEAIGVVKRYGAVIANDHIDLCVESGEIHAIIGENGAGKSTLMSMLYGLQRPDEGAIRVRGQDVHFHSALDAIAAGMGMVHQAFKLFNSLTVWENIVFGTEPQRMGFIDRRAARAEVAQLAQSHGLQLAPDDVVRTESPPLAHRIRRIRRGQKRVRRRPGAGQRTGNSMGLQ